MTYVSTLNVKTPAKVIWDHLNKIRGKYRSFSVPLIQSNTTVCQTLDEQANVLGEHFRQVSSSDHFSPTFLTIKRDAERRKFPAESCANEPYNQPFTKYELEQALTTSKRTSPGPDNIHYDMLRHLCSTSMDTLLLFFNRVWEEGTLPCSWKVATVIPILKIGKDPSIATSYRPIALTSCLGKVFERMVNSRLIHFLTANRTLDQNQCGFRRGFSTLDHIVRLETWVRESFIRGQFCMSIFFDLEKAYDTTWRHGILQDLYSYGVCGRMFKLIQNFLQDRFSGYAWERLIPAYSPRKMVYPKDLF